VLSQVIDIDLIFIAYGSQCILQFSLQEQFIQVLSIVLLTFSCLQSLACHKANWQFGGELEFLKRIQFKDKKHSIKWQLYLLYVPNQLKSQTVI
jgi:hypothetical protein